MLEFYFTQDDIFHLSFKSNPIESQGIRNLNQLSDFYLDEYLVFPLNIDVQALV